MMNNNTFEYPHPLDVADGCDPPVPLLTVRELFHRDLSQQIRSKPEWITKVQDRELFKKWYIEARSFWEARLDGQPSTLAFCDSDDIEYAWTELMERYKPWCESQGENGIHPVIDCVWKSDGAVEEDLRQELIKAVSTLEDVPENQKDWHPGSDQQVLDLVHPSLFPIIYDVTINANTGKPIEAPREVEDVRLPETRDRWPSATEPTTDGNGWSPNFAWLPSDFKVSDTGEVEIMSYINNLSSPEQEILFHPILSKIFARFVPLFNLCLSDLASKNHARERVGGRGLWSYYGNRWDDGEYVSPEIYQKKDKEIWNQFLNNQVITETFDNCERLDKQALLHSDNQETINHVFYDYGRLELEEMWSPPDVTSFTTLQGKTCKVIVKLANIVLTPEDPKYKGGAWHYEAMRNERIIATGIYYYAQENITESTLSFRQLCPDLGQREGKLPQDSTLPVLHHLEAFDHAVQETGSVVTSENRCLVFPNLFQHGVGEFELVDPEKPGYRKILVFFLCDPTDESIVSTSSVDPQQPLHYRLKLDKALHTTRVDQLPEELFSMILDYASFPVPPPFMSREDAEKYRKKLMVERSNFTTNSDMVTGFYYSL